jgi:hypothetical protein
VLRRSPATTHFQAAKVISNAASRFTAWCGAISHLFRGTKGWAGDTVCV